MVKYTEGLSSLNELLIGISNIPLTGRVDIPVINGGEIQYSTVGYLLGKYKFTAQTVEDERLYWFPVDKFRSPMREIFIKAKVKTVKGGFFDGFTKGFETQEVFVKLKDFSSTNDPFNGIGSVTEYLKELIEYAKT